ncbi:hypothetical protein AWB75_04644 [Caballeronia catudaia]|uniref:Uncharacterized protein n=1 Tax=Caballeronia catudaia TaxID=1777136 RepID=A0A158C7H4_9BURK|nr:hypothetical protein AWB75_04644 [Caballeronia catudaia]
MLFELEIQRVEKRKSDETASHARTSTGTRSMMKS